MPDALYSGLLSGGWRTLDFVPFREGIEAHWIEKAADSMAPAVALLKYAAGARAPRHRHAGLETIIVLEGCQSDENGAYAAGAVVLNAEGSEHSVWSEDGCVVLINWARPVVFIGEEK
jgi:anti-sigma factor ChrR (cupin superfamily)